MHASPALRHIPPIPPTIRPQVIQIRRPRLPRGRGPRPLIVQDPVIQASPGAVAMPSTSQSFEGVGNNDWVLPPDPNGAVGPGHYVQWVNLSFAVFSKSGVLLYGPAAGNTLWAGFGGACEARNDGDPIVLYDRQADRWLMSQLALENDFNGPFWQCVAVSQTGDPTGAYFRYAFKIHDTKLNDYPKLAIWPDGYYLAVNQFIVDCSFFFCTEQWAGQRVVAFERDKMLQGLAAQTIAFELAPTQNLGGMLPADSDGSAPPAGAPAVFAQIDDDEFNRSLIPVDRLQIWEFHVDWTTPSISTFTQAGVLPVAPFSSSLCSYDPCVPQPGYDFLGLPSPRLDALSDRLMYRLQYRNLGAYQTLVTNHTVDVGGDRAGIRWYELRNSGSGWGIHQQGTYAPIDGLHRWMGSIAMDGSGNIALGFSLGNRTIYPSIAYVGRQAGDLNPGVMTEAETVLVWGRGAQEDSSGRWGDYSSLSLDPTDDCTFYYTNEYLTYTDVIFGVNWQTRIGAFRFPSCGAATPTLSINDVTVTEGGPGAGGIATFTISLSPASTSPVTVWYQTADGTAGAASGDYVGIPLTTLTFEPGETSKQISITVTGDTTPEPDETFFVNLSNPSGATLARAQGVGTIRNDDASITVIAPNGGEIWRINRRQTIRWNSSLVSGTVKIELSRDGGGTWVVLFASTANDGSQNWKVTGPAAQAKIRVSGNNEAVSDTSDGVFKIGK